MFFTYAIVNGAYCYLNGNENNIGVALLKAYDLVNSPDFNEIEIWQLNGIYPKTTEIRIATFYKNEVR